MACLFVCVRCLGSAVLVVFCAWSAGGHEDLWLGLPLGADHHAVLLVSVGELAVLLNVCHSRFPEHFVFSLPLHA